MKTNKIHNMDCLQGIKKLEKGSIDCCVTSPPYWALRDYRVEGQLGLEPTFEKYITKLCDIFDEVKRVLKKSGTCWVNIGDTYGSHRSGESNFTASKYKQSTERKPTKGFEKSLIGIPFRFALEMINRGWILRNTIIWYKPNCMPSSVKDRFTVDFEYVFFFVKSKKYYFETLREPHKLISIKRACRARTSNKLKEGAYAISYMGENTSYKNMKERQEAGELRAVHKDGRNKRTVWKVTTKPFKEAHFATYPEDLIEPMIKAGCPEFVCIKCGKPREKILVPTKEYAKFLGKGWHDHTDDKGMGVSGIKKYDMKGYTKCGCGKNFSSGIVLDPFMGAGTTALVALKQNKKFIGFELNKEYIKMANKRILPFLEQTKLKKFTGAKTK